ncbi:MAG: hypothetical protein H0W50_02990 [Parachlamydiaceae bacterium]|nr:hypothetical protein [Parachlamydiaceae bacterium]
MGIDTNNRTVDPNAPATGGGGTTQVSNELTKTIGNLLTEMMGVKGKGGVDKKGGVGEVDGNVTETFIKFNTDGSLKVSVDFADPKVRQASDPLIELYISNLVLETIDGSDDPNKSLILSLIKGREGTTGNLTVTPSANPGKSETCAFLGGLVMVALGDILALFAKLESFIKKMSSELFLSSQATMKDLAECQAKNTEEKAKIQSDAKILQAVVTAVTTGIQVGCSIGAWSSLKAGDPLASNKANIITAYGTASSSIGQATSNLIEARSILGVGQIEASNIRMQFMQEQMNKMQDTYSKMGNDADQKVGEIWDLLKNMFSNLFQAFRSLTGK